MQLRHLNLRDPRVLPAVFLCFELKYLERKKNVKVETIRVTVPSRNCQDTSIITCDTNKGETIIPTFNRFTVLPDLQEEIPCYGNRDTIDVNDDSGNISGVQSTCLGSRVHASINVVDNDVDTQCKSVKESLGISLEQGASIDVKNSNEVVAGVL